MHMHLSSIYPQMHLSSIQKILMVYDFKVLPITTQLKTVKYYLFSTIVFKNMIFEK